jgi:hypothetical protein
MPRLGCRHNRHCRSLCPELQQQVAIFQAIATILNSSPTQDILAPGKGPFRSSRPRYPYIPARFREIADTSRGDLDEIAGAGFPARQLRNLRGEQQRRDSLPRSHCNGNAKATNGPRIGSPQVDSRARVRPDPAANRRWT